MVKKNPGHIPERTCISCSKKGPKGSFLRVVRLKDGSVVVSTDPKIYGRSAYVCPSVDCIERSVKRLEGKVKIKLSDEDRQRIKNDLLALLNTQGEG